MVSNHPTERGSVTLEFSCIPMVTDAIFTSTAFSLLHPRFPFGWVLRRTGLSACYSCHKESLVSRYFERSQCSLQILWMQYNTKSGQLFCTWGKHAPDSWMDVFTGFPGGWERNHLQSWRRTKPTPMLAECLDITTVLFPSSSPYYLLSSAILNPKALTSPWRTW